MLKVDGLKGIKKGDSVIVSGPYVAVMAITISSCVTKLIAGLDKWLMNQPSPSVD